MQELRNRKEQTQDRARKILCSTLFTLCDDAIQKKLQSMEKFDEINSSDNAIGLLQLIDDKCSSTHDTKYNYLQAFFALKKVLNFGQKPDMTKQQTTIRNSTYW